jgi:hypothetical protein
MFPAFVYLLTLTNPRLLDFRTQERYYAKIVERYMAFCSDAGRGDELLRRLARLDLSQDKQTETSPQMLPYNNSVTSNFNSSAGLSASAENDKSILMMSMRKLREGIKASHRIDDFSIQAYIFCIRLSILMKEWESYNPALLYLLDVMHKSQPLSSGELQEFVAYKVLDLSCRENNLVGAHLLRKAYGLRDPKVDAVLRALTYDNYWLFWNVKKSVEGHRAKLMEFAEDGMKKQALKCLGRSYFTMDLTSLEQYTNSSWSSLVKDYNVGWQLEGTKVIIRKPKGR